MDISFLIILAAVYTVLFGFLGGIYLFYGFQSFNVIHFQCWSTIAHCTSKLRHLIDLIIPKCVSDSIGGWITHLLYERNHYIQCFYILLIISGYMVYSFTAFQYVYKTIWGAIPFLLLLINIICFIVSCWKDPGIVKDSNCKTYVKEFKYDGVLYHGRTICGTCNLVKPARSKHCFICNQCVSKFDHHCAWMNNCIGRFNYKYFIGFLVSLATICYYTCFLVTMVFIHIIYRDKLHLIKFQDGYGNIYESNLQSIINYLAGQFPAMALLLIFLLLVGTILSIFTIFHFYLLLTNKTTTEFLKMRSNSKFLHRDNVNRCIYNNGFIKNIIEVICT